MCVCALFVLQCCLQFAVAFVVVVVVVAARHDIKVKLLCIDEMTITAVQ